MNAPLRTAAVTFGSFILAGAILMGATGCQSLGEISEIATGVGVAVGAIDENQAGSINRVASAAEKTFTDITPEQEYWIGRTIAATVVNQYPPLKQDRLTTYVNTMGQALAALSDQPETFGGYRFLVLDSNDINAFAAPGGLIFVTRGLLKCCRNEDALAAVLAHEIAHVQLKHGLQAIQKSRLTGALTILATEAGKNLGGADLKQVTEAFEGSINDITQTLMNSGYARTSEYQADALAVTILTRAGYNPGALKDMLAQMKSQLKPGGLDFAKTHPDPADRIARLKAATGGLPAPAARQRRFAAAMAAVN